MYIYIYLNDYHYYVLKIVKVDVQRNSWFRSRKQHLAESVWLAVKLQSFLEKIIYVDYKSGDHNHFKIGKGDVLKMSTIQLRFSFFPI